MSHRHVPALIWRTYSLLKWRAPCATPRGLAQTLLLAHKRARVRSAARTDPDSSAGALGIGGLLDRSRGRSSSANSYVHSCTDQADQAPVLAYSRKGTPESGPWSLGSASTNDEHWRS